MILLVACGNALFSYDTTTLTVVLAGLYLLFPLYISLATYFPGARLAVDTLNFPLESDFIA